MLILSNVVNNFFSSFFSLLSFSVFDSVLISSLLLLFSILLLLLLIFFFDCSCVFFLWAFEFKCSFNLLEQLNFLSHKSQYKLTFLLEFNFSLFFSSSIFFIKSSFFFKYVS